jgi:hypothetical protein
MSRLRTGLGLCVICALALAAYAVPGALAQNFYTCAKGGKSFSDSHCTVASGAGEFGHVEFTGKTSITGTNETTGGLKSLFKLTSVQSGVVFQIEATELQLNATIENHLAYAEGSGYFVLKGVFVTFPAGKGCVVRSVPVTKEEKATLHEIHSKEVILSTEGLLNELQVRAWPLGGTLAEFTVEGCSAAALNHTYALKGSFKGSTSGTTTNFTHNGVTAQKTLTLAGQNAGIEGSLTIKGQNGNGLALT